MSRASAAIALLLALAFGDGRVTAGSDPAGRIGVIAGEVVDESGAAVAGVVVEAFPRPQRDLRVERGGPAIRFNPDWWSRASAPAPSGAATTDLRGRFRIDGLDPSQPMSVRLRPKDGRASDPVLAFPATPWDLIRLVARADAARVVRVEDASGQFVTADVVALDQEAQIGGREDVASGYAIPAGANQALAILGLPRGHSHLEVRVPGVAVVRGVSAHVPGPAGVFARIADPAGVPVGGTVRDASGAAVRGARVAVGTNGAKRGEEGVDTIRLAETDETGAWRVEGLPAGRLIGVSVRAEGFLPIDDAEADRRIEAKDSPTIDLVLARGATATGVVSGPDGKPVEGARISIGEGRATTNGDGRFRLADVGLGLREIGVEASGFLAPGHRPFAWEDPGGIWLDGRATGAITAPGIRLRRGVRVEGRVLNEAGGGVADAWVVATSRGPWGSSSSVLARTRADATFTIDGLAPDEAWTISARAEGLASDLMGPAPLPERSPFEVTLVARRVARLSGRVVDPAGNAVKGLELVAVGPDDRKAVTGADGRFAFEGLRAGSYRLVASHLRWTPKEKSSVMTRWVAPGEDASDVRMTVEPPRAIAGIVVDEKGKPAEGVIVGIRADRPPENFTRYGPPEEESWDSTATTDGGGRFRFENLAPGGFHIHPEKETGGSELAGGEESLRLVWYRDALPEAAPAKPASMSWSGLGAGGGSEIPLEVRALDPKGEPVAQAAVWVYAIDSGGSAGRGSSLENGVLRTSVPSGAGSITVQVSDARDASGAPLDCQESSVKGLSARVGRVEVRLSPGRTIAGRVVDDEQRPVAGALVLAGRTKGGSIGPGNYSWRAATDATGAFLLVGLPEGRIELVSRPDERWASAHLEAASGSTALIELKKASWISGRIVDEAGRPLPGVGIQTGDPDGRSIRGEDARGESALDGSFRIGPIEGKVNVMAPTRWAGSDDDAPEFGRDVRTDVTAGTTGLELKLSRVSRVSGEVVVPNGFPADEVKVRLDADPPDPSRKPIEGSQSWREEGFAIDDVPPGRYRLTATISSWNGHDHKTQSTSVLITAPAEGVRVTFGEPAGIRGRIAGEGIEGCRISIIEPRDAVLLRADVAVGKDGAFAWETAEQGPFTVYACRAGDDRYALLKDVKPSDAPRDLTLIAGSRIEGRIEGVKTPLDPSRAAVWARSAHGLVAHATIEADGRFQLRGLPPDETWIVEARVAGFFDVLAGSKAGIASGASGVKLGVAAR